MFQYYIWFVLLFMLLVPLLPVQSFHLTNFYDWLIPLGQKHTSSSVLLSLRNTSENILTPNDWLQNFSVSVNRSSSNLIDLMLLLIWVIGVITMTIMTYLSNRNINKVRKTAQLVQDNEILSLFEQCKQNVEIHKNILLYTSSLISSPITFGLIRPCIIVPSTIKANFSKKDIYHVFLHELQHYKHKDLFTNYVLCLFRIIYWFHPFVWYALNQMRIDREIACDSSVLNILDKNSYIEYGNTILNFADKILSSSSLTHISEIGGSSKQIKKRIIMIASFQAETKWLRFKSITIFLLVTTLVLSSTPILCLRVLADQNYDFSNHNTQYEDLSSYFQGYQGSFVLYDLTSNQYHIYNQQLCEKRISPISTYKPYSALYALEAGYITPNSSVLRWDGTQYSYKAWNRDQDLSSAMKNSVNWYFQSLDDKAGTGALKKYYKQIGYGNSDLSSGISDYWLEASLKISTIEQVELLKAFYLNTFGFKDENIQAVKKALRLSQSQGAVLSGKTGTGNVNGKNINGWFIGYVEKQGNTFIFATHIQNDDNSNGSVAAQITLSILNDKNIYVSNK